MFTGIVQAVGTIARVEPLGGDTRLLIDAYALDMHDVRRGDSICVAGVCLTAAVVEGARFAADISLETLKRTTLGLLKSGDGVNLEKPLRLADRLGGHLVAGHVDAIARTISVQPDARSQRWVFELPPGLERYVAVKGSVCVDGVSLTVNEVEHDCFGVTLIPHTLEGTTFRRKRAGDSVNLEVDLIARYVERLVRGET